MYVPITIKLSFIELINELNNGINLLKIYMSLKNLK